MSDWAEACDPVPARRPELSPAERRRRLALMSHERAQRGWLRAGANAVSVYHVDDAFDEMGS